AGRGLGAAEDSHALQLDGVMLRVVGHNELTARPDVGIARAPFAPGRIAVDIGDRTGDPATRLDHSGGRIHRVAWDRAPALLLGLRAVHIGTVSVLEDAVAVHLHACRVCLPYTDKGADLPDVPVLGGAPGPGPGCTS